jgi:hypothetical protein
VGELAKALDDYASRMTEVVQRDREFNADVSHELRTPLAVIRGATELLLSTRPGRKNRQRLLRIQRAEMQCTDLIRFAAAAVAQRARPRPYPSHASPNSCSTAPRPAGQQAAGIAPGGRERRVDRGCTGIGGVGRAWET